MYIIYIHICGLLRCAPYDLYVNILEEEGSLRRADRRGKAPFIAPND